jgi:hypothetical protein
MDRLQLFCQAMNVKVDRIGRYLSVMETRAEHCKQKAARYAQRAKRAQSKIDRTKSMVLYYLESHDLKQVESDDFTLRRQKNSQDTVFVTNPDAIPPDLKRYELKVSGDIWMKVFLALPEELAAALQAAVSSAEPMNHGDQAVGRGRQDHRWRSSQAPLPSADCIGAIRHDQDAAPCRRAGWLGTCCRPSRLMKPKMTGAT